MGLHGSNRLCLRWPEGEGYPPLRLVVVKVAVAADEHPIKTARPFRGINSPVEQAHDGRLGNAFGEVEVIVGEGLLLGQPGLALIFLARPPRFAMASKFRRK